MTQIKQSRKCIDCETCTERSPLFEPLSQEELALIKASLEANDQAERAGRILENEGLTTTTLTTGAVHKHPMVDAEERYRASFMKAWIALGLNEVPDGKSDPAIRNTPSDELVRGLNREPCTDPRNPDCCVHVP